MAQFSIGFVYVLTNEAMPGIVKIGRTSRLSEDRAKDLSGSGVPHPFDVVFRTVTSNPEGLEKEVHEYLKDQRVNPKREFFRITPEEAAETILHLRQKVDGIESWTQKSPVRGRAGDRILLSMKAGQIFVLGAYSEINAAAADVVDVWQAHADEDTLELYFVEESEYTAELSDDEPFSTTDPVPFLNRTSTVDNAIPFYKGRLVPGDRLLWMDSSDSKNLTGVILEAYSHCQVIARTLQPKFTEEGFPLLLNMVTYEQMPASMIEAGRYFVRLPVPRVWAPRNPNDEEQWSKEAQKEVEASFWMFQLAEKKLGRRVITDRKTFLVTKNNNKYSYRS